MQLAAQLLECVAHPTLDRVLGRVDGLADLLEREPAELAHQEHLALIVGQAIDRVGDPLANGRGFGASLGRDLLGRGRVEDAQARVFTSTATLRLERQGLAEFLPAALVDTQVASDREDPSRELGAGLVAIFGSNHAQEHLLQHLVGSGAIVDAAQQEIVEAPLVSNDEDLERRRLAVAEREHQRLVAARLVPVARFVSPGRLLLVRHGPGLANLRAGPWAKQVHGGFACPPLVQRGRAGIDSAAGPGEHGHRGGQRTSGGIGAEARDWKVPAANAGSHMRIWSLRYARTLARLTSVAAEGAFVRCQSTRRFRGLAWSTGQNTPLRP